MQKMKTIYLAAVLFFAAFGQLAAQSSGKPLKVGYTNVNYILSISPDGKRIEKELQAYNSQLEKQLQSKMQTYQKKLQKYQEGGTTMPQSVRKDKERELMSLQKSIEQFRKDAEVDLQNKQAELLEPIYEKISNTIQEVADENGYTYVFNSDAGFGTTPTILVGPEEHDITNLVLKKLDIPIPEKQPKNDKSLDLPGNNPNLNPGTGN